MGICTPYLYVFVLTSLTIDHSSWNASLNYHNALLKLRIEVLASLIETRFTFIPYSASCKRKEVPPHTKKIQPQLVTTRALVHDSFVWHLLYWECLEY